jgi:hypothetical protein
MSDDAFRSGIFEESCGCQVEFVEANETIRITPCKQHAGRDNKEERRQLAERARGMFQRLKDDFRFDEDADE